MKVYIKIEDVYDSYELIDIITKMKKLRESIYSETSEDFVMDIRTKIKV